MSSLFKVNREPREDFRLAKSVMQGCPLAPYLFILATNVLGHMLDNPKHEIEGLHLPKGGCIRDQTFANDTTLYLKGSPSNLNKARVVLKPLCLAFGAKSIGVNPRPYGPVRKKRNGCGDKKSG